MRTRLSGLLFRESGWYIGLVSVKVLLYWIRKQNKASPLVRIYRMEG